MRSVPELLSPAGDMEKLKMAVAYGADAVYLAWTEFGMRVSAGNFNSETLPAAVSYAKERGVRVYLTLNTIPHPGEFARLNRFIAELPSLGVDAVIAADPGVFSSVLKFAPGVPIHMSTQAGVVNAASALFWHGAGAERVILARELSISEIADIRKNTPSSLEIECFVHGSMCVSFSGRCLLSNYMTGRDANRGACAQSCRFKYYLREEKREGEYFEIFDEPEGSYILNSKDLSAISFLDRLMDAGVSSFKIEGRSKSSYYTAAATNAYRLALRDLEAGRPFEPRLIDELKKTSHRELTGGFYLGNPEELLSETRNSGYIRDWDVIAFSEGTDELGYSILIQKNRFRSGAYAELLTPGKLSIPIKLGQLYDMEGSPIDEALHPHMRLKTRLPADAPPFSILRVRRD